MIKDFLFVLFSLCGLIQIQSALAVTIGLSCLHNPQTGMKIAILHDYHYAQLCRDNIEGQKLEDPESVLKSQKEELTHLVETVAKDQNESALFLVECTALRRSEILNGNFTQLPDTLTVIPKIFLKQDYDRGNATFECADPRSLIDIFAATNFVFQFEQAKKALDDGTLAPLFSQITIEHYLDHIKDTYEPLLEEIDSVSLLTADNKQKIKRSAKESYTQLSQFVDSATQKHQLKKTDHLLDLYETQIKEDNGYLFNRVCDWGNLRFDARLLWIIDHVMQHKDEYPNKLVIQTGAAHAKLLEHRLSQHNFELVSYYGDTDNVNVDANGEITYSKDWKSITVIPNIGKLVIKHLENSSKNNKTT